MELPRTRPIGSKDTKTSETTGCRPALINGFGFYWLWSRLAANWLLP